MAGHWHTIAGPDGRALHVVEDGDPAGVAVLAHHGTPGAGLLHEPWVEDAAARGIRLISYDRPGFAGSARDPGRTVASAAADAAAIMDALGVERFATWGASGGGPHALACAALLGDRVAACATLGSIAPRVNGIDYFGRMNPEGVRELEASIAGEAELRAFIERSMTSPPAIETLFGAADRGVLGGPLGEYLMQAIRAGTAGGFDGWADDDLAFVAPWGFDVGEIAVPVQVWQGRQDLMVPYAHGVWLARRLPRVDVRMSPDDGHITLLARRMPEIHSFLRERL